MHRIVVYLIKAIKMHTRINNKTTAKAKKKTANAPESEKKIYTHHDGNKIIIAIFIECEDRKNHEKSTKLNQYIYKISVFLPARLSIDLFERPKIRDMHINKVNLSPLFFCSNKARYQLAFFYDHCCRWPDINWSDELIFFFCEWVYMPRIFITCKVHIIFIKAIILWCYRLFANKRTQPNITCNILILNNDVLTR